MKIKKFLDKKTSKKTKIEDMLKGAGFGYENVVVQGGNAKKKN